MGSNGVKTESVVFGERRSPGSEIVWASLVYSLVPYLGVLFVPVTVVAAAAKLLPRIAGSNEHEKRSARAGIALSFLVALGQVFLWWLLYFIPESLK